MKRTTMKRLNTKPSALHSTRAQRLTRRPLESYPFTDGTIEVNSIRSSKNSIARSRNLKRGAAGLPRRCRTRRFFETLD